MPKKTYWLQNRILTICLFCFWFYKLHLPLHPIHIIQYAPCSFTSHHDITTQSHLHSCYIINFTASISSHFLQTIFHVTDFLQTIIHLIHFLYHSPSHSNLYSKLFSCSPFCMILPLKINNLGVYLDGFWFYTLLPLMKTE